MSTCAAVLCKDERDVIEAVCRHLAAHVDALYVTDNGSTDGTREILEDLRAELPLQLIHDPEPGHYQGRKTTAMAMRALEAGHRWLIPCDADEIWIAPEGRTISDWLDGLGREHQFVKATIYNHVATGLDPPAMVSSIEAARALAEAQILGDAVVIRPEPNPFKRIGWRQRAPLDMRWGKIACRLRPDLEIDEGNHSARTHGVGTTGYGLEIRHFPYRSAEHFCNPPEAPIWMADLSFKPIGEIEEGDQIMGAARIEGVYRTMLIPAEVTAVHRRRSPVVRVEMESGRWLRCTPDHLWRQQFFGSLEVVSGERGAKRLDGKGYQDVRRRGTDGMYLPPKVGRSLSHVIEPTPPVSPTDERLAGWLAGMFDGEGTSSGYMVQIAQSRKANADIYEAICQALRHFGFSFTEKFDRITLTGGKQAYVDFHNITRPHRRTTTVPFRSRGTRRLRDIYEGTFGARYCKGDRIVSVEPDGRDEVIGLTTATGNYVAWGYASKNCAKAVKGLAALEATDLDEGTGAHWRVYGQTVRERGKEAGEAWFYDAFYSENPEADDSLVYDPVTPYLRGGVAE